ncbi:MAG: cellulosome anchor protein [Firmicutes bacterium]|nr:cellulosome anchor protein [Bacillota bacterium]
MKAKTRKCRFFILLALTLFLVTPGLKGQLPGVTIVEPPEEEPEMDFFLNTTNQERLILENDYIAVAVNNSADATGRFGVKVTQGDPLRTDDDGQVLIYGFERPWTSFTTVRIDGQNYIFGGPTKKRSGGTGEYGTVVSPPTWDPELRSITMTCRIGLVDVIQEISIVESTTTGYPDTAKIKYSIINRDTVAHEIGLRVVIDTMLGENDGAPFRIGETAIQTDAVREQSQLPEFWQAFDTLTAPKVIAQGTLKGREATPPDFLYFTNWGSVADSHWDVPLEPERDFTRAGEFELDSAAVYMWQPVTVPAAGSSTYVMYYGLGGVTVVPGQLQLGVSSPAEVLWDESERSFSIVAYIQNTGAGPAMSTRARLNLPPTGLALTGKKPLEIYIGRLEPGEMTQLHWEVKPTGTFGKLMPFSVVASAINIPENRVERSVTVVGPPKLTLAVNPPATLKVVNEQVTPDPYPITARIKNTGESEAYGVVGSLQLGEGMEPAPKEILRRYVGNLKPGEEYELTWYLRPEGIGKRSYLGIQFESNSTKPVMYIAGVRLPVLTPKLRLTALNKPQAGELLILEARVDHFPVLSGVEFDLLYNPAFMEIIRVSRGLFFVDQQAMTPWHPGTIDSSAGKISGIGGTRTSTATGNASVATFYCQLGTEPGEWELLPANIKLQSDQDKIPAFVVEGLKIRINEQGGVTIGTFKIDR